jgi:hypothetical protein
MPPVVGPEPSYRVAAFYYPWYRTPEVDSYWDHWDQGGLRPPLTIASDFYPALGIYSAADPVVMAQHCAWLREAGVGILVSSWWGPGSRTDEVVPLLLDMADRYRLKVAFHIEPYSGRSESRLVSDIGYLYAEYGDHPAFFRTTSPSRWSQDNGPRGLFYVWASRYANNDLPPVEPSYWRGALDQVHGLPDGGVVLSDENASSWVDEGHFDGLYNYGVLDIDVSTGYSWARSVPLGAWYVPGVNPGFSGQRVGLPENLTTPRRDGATYEDRWEAALSTGVEPQLVTITSFNEWHEGTQIEPAAAGVEDGSGRAFEDYGALGPEGYLALTRRMVDEFLSATWSETRPLRIRLATTSDWTELTLVSGAGWLRPDLVSFSGEASTAEVRGDLFALGQPINRAEAGASAEMLVDALFSDWDSDGMLVLKIERGSIGSTLVEISRFEEGNWVLVRTIRWAGTTGDGRNTFTTEVPAEELLGE